MLVFNLVVGGASGIGLSYVKKLLKRNEYVIVVDRQKIDIVDGNLIYFKCDISDKSSLDIAFNEIVTKYSIKNLFITAGIHHLSNFMDITEVDIDSVFNTNIKSYILILQYVVKNMLKNGYGRIALISSDQSFIAKPDSLLYGMSKLAITQIVKSLAIDYTSNNILTNAICPGTVDTPFITGILDKLDSETAKKVQESLHKETALEGLISSDAVADLADFLLSEKNQYINGSLYRIDGGYISYIK